MKYDDAIFDLHWKAVKTDQPKVFAICDVSGSVADYARFMLMFLYSLEEVLPKVRAFAFSSELGEVSDLFKRNSVDDAIAATRKVIEQTKRVKQGLLQTLMTRGIGHTRFKKTEIGEIPEDAHGVVAPGGLFLVFADGVVEDGACCGDAAGGLA